MSANPVNDNLNAHSSDAIEDFVAGIMEARPVAEAALIAGIDPASISNVLLSLDVCRGADFLAAAIHEATVAKLGPTPLAWPA